MNRVFIVFDNNDGRIQIVLRNVTDAQRYVNTHEGTFFNEYYVYEYENSYLASSDWSQMPKVPDHCYEEFGADLDGCSTQQNGGCGECHLIKYQSEEPNEPMDTYSGYDGTFLNI